MNFGDHMNTGIFMVNLTVRIYWILGYGRNIHGSLPVKENFEFDVEHTIIWPLLLAC